VVRAVSCDAWTSRSILIGIALIGIARQGATGFLPSVIVTRKGIMGETTLAAKDEILGR
jgi:hypothetical protein